jgi:hypothetical protein
MLRPFRAVRGAPGPDYGPWPGHLVLWLLCLPLLPTLWAALEVPCLVLGHTPDPYLASRDLLICERCAVELTRSPLPEST